MAIFGRSLYKSNNNTIYYLHFLRNHLNKMFLIAKEEPRGKAIKTHNIQKRVKIQIFFNACRRWALLDFFLFFFFNVLILILLHSVRVHRKGASEKEFTGRFAFKAGWIFHRLWCKRQKYILSMISSCFVLWTLRALFLGLSLSVIPLKIKFSNINKSHGWRVEITFWLNFVGNVNSER